MSPERSSFNLSNCSKCVSTGEKLLYYAARGNDTAVFFLKTVDIKEKSRYNTICIQKQVDDPFSPHGLIDLVSVHNMRNAT